MPPTPRDLVAISASSAPRARNPCRPSVDGSARSMRARKNRRPPMYRWLLLPLVLPSLVAATDYTVSPGQRITDVLRRMGSGDTLTIHGGTYDENNLQPPSGSTVQGAPGETVILRPTGGTAAGFELSSN